MISWEGSVITMDRFVVTRVRFVITTEGVCLQHKVGDYNRGFVTTTEVWEYKMLVITTEGL